MRKSQFSGLKSIEIPTSVTYIDDIAFSGCSSLSSIQIPSSISHIGNYIVSGCTSLSIIKVDEGNKYYDSRDNCNAIIDSETDRLIVGCINTIIPLGIRYIGPYAFYNCGLQSISIPNSVIKIEDNAFENCKNLSNITIPNSVTEINDQAFQSCDNLVSMIIGKSINYIGRDFIYSCNKITDITCLAEDIPETDKDTFRDFPFFKVTLHVPESSIEAYRTTYPWNQFKEIVAIKGETSIESINILNTSADIIYDLQGQRTSNPQNGLYIKNGKKVILK